MAVKVHIQDTVRNLVCKGFDHEFGKPALALQENADWKALKDTGSQLWLDTGDLEEATKLYTAEFDALTTNNTLLNKEVQKGIYDELVKETAAKLREADPDMDEGELVLEIAFVLNAHHALRLVQAFDARVSVELHTDMANDVECSVEYGKRYYEICPERFIVKIPLTPAGFLAARKLTIDGIPINFTLGFSARQNYLAARLSKPAYVNVFMGRLGAFLLKSNLGQGGAIGEKTTLATQRELIILRNAGETDTQLIGASVRRSSQIADLAGIDVFTMPTRVAGDYIDDPEEILTRQVETDPSLSLANNVEPLDFNGTTLWEVPESLKISVDALLDKNLDELTAESLQEYFSDAGFPDLLPKWSDADIQTVIEDGKIPVYETWRERLTTKECGLDALMNLSALYSFATDQKAFDDRVRSLIST